MALYTTAQGAGQDGRAVGGIWSATTPTLQASNVPLGISKIGLVFDTSGFTIEEATVRLRLAAGTGTPIGSRLRLYLVPETNPADYSQTRLPGGRGEVLIAELLYAGTPAGQDLSLVLGQTFDAANAATVAASLATFAGVVASPLWSSRLAFMVDCTTATGFLLFEAAELVGGTPPRLETSEIAPEFQTMAHVAKTLRSAVKAKLNAWPDVTSLGLTFVDMPGRPIDALIAGGFKGYVATHPEEAGPRQGSPRRLEVLVMVVSAAASAEAAADQLDDSEQAVLAALLSSPRFPGLVGDLEFRISSPVQDSTGNRHYGTRAMTFVASYIAKED